MSWRMPSTETTWHACSTESATRALRADVTRGLSKEEARIRREQVGPNRLGETQQRSLLSIAIHQFRSLIVGLLVAAAGVALALGEVIEASAILGVIVLNAAIGFFTEWKAATALDALRQQTRSVARVLRDGEEHQIDAEELVPGDLVLLNAGDRVPADGRLIEDTELQVDEAALTGE